MTCPFCDEAPPGLDKVYTRLVPDQHLPATPGHTLIIPRRHVRDWFEMTIGEQVATLKYLDRQRTHLAAMDPTITGFNIGMNIGADAGQTVFHAHTHLIPRRRGDVPNPRWGIARALILDRYKEV